MRGQAEGHVACSAPKCPGPSPAEKDCRPERSRPDPRAHDVTGSRSIILAWKVYHPVESLVRLPFRPPTSSPPFHTLHPDAFEGTRGHAYTSRYGRPNIQAREACAQRASSGGEAKGGEPLGE